MKIVQEHELEYYINRSTYDGPVSLFPGISASWKESQLRFAGSTGPIEIGKVAE